MQNLLFLCLGLLGSPRRRSEYDADEVCSNGQPQQYAARKVAERTRLLAAKNQIGHIEQNAQEDAGDSCFANVHKTPPLFVV